MLTDILEGKPEGLALDMNQSPPDRGLRDQGRRRDHAADGSGYEATAGSDIVVITAGLPRKPGMSRMDLIETNAKIVRGVAENIAKHSPDAVIIVVSNPLDEMTALTQLASGFPKNGCSARPACSTPPASRNFVAEELGVPVGIGHDPDPRLARRHDGAGARRLHRRRQAAGRPAAAEIDELVDRTRNGGAEVVALLKTGSAYYAPSAAAARMVKADRRGLRRGMPVCAWVDGEYGISGVYLGVLAEIGAGGVTGSSSRTSRSPSSPRSRRPPRPSGRSRATSRTSNSNQQTSAAPVARATRSLLPL